MNRAYSLLFIPMILAPLIGLRLYVELDWWMFFSCLLAYFIQLLPWSLLVADPKKDIVTINVNEIEKYAIREKRVLILYVGILVFIALLDLFPFYAMSETMMSWFFGNKLFLKTYEGGILVSILAILMLILNAFSVAGLLIETTDIFTIKKDYEKTGLTPTEQLENEKRIAAQREKDKLRYEKEKYGEGHKVISRQLKLYINEEQQKLFVNKKEYDFKDILDFSIQDNARTIHSGSTSIARTNNGSMFGRAAIGGLVAGNVGAVIGGATASKTIETSGSSSAIVHDYSVVITLNSLSTPMITLQIGQDQNLVNKISSFLTVIVRRNSN